VTFISFIRSFFKIKHFISMVNLIANEFNQDIIALVIS